ncbi:hypothetical protein VTO73DRAFT_14959 [Trametes versicolor]
MLQTPRPPGPPFPAIAREDSEDNKKCSHRLMVNKFHRSSARDAVKGGRYKGSGRCMGPAMNRNTHRVTTNA